MKKFGIGNGVVRTDQGGELAHSTAYRELMLNTFGYVVESTGANSPSQNGGAEIYNKRLAVKTRTLLYGAGLPAKFWSIALLPSVYFHNRLVHSATNKTPYEGWYGRKPDITHLKTFGSRVCVKRTGSRRCKLDRHDLVSLSHATTPFSMKPGTISPLDHLQPNSSTILGWRLKRTP
jgi:hypothetical protein